MVSAIGEDALGGGPAEITAFLQHLFVTRNVPASTPDQAFTPLVRCPEIKKSSRADIGSVELEAFLADLVLGKTLPTPQRQLPVAGALSA